MYNYLINGQYGYNIGVGAYGKNAHNMYALMGRPHYAPIQYKPEAGTAGFGNAFGYAEKDISFVEASLARYGLSNYDGKLSYQELQSFGVSLHQARQLDLNRDGQVDLSEHAARIVFEDDPRGWTRNVRAGGGAEFPDLDGVITGRERHIGQRILNRAPDAQLILQTVQTHLQDVHQQYLQGRQTSHISRWLFGY